MTTELTQHRLHQLLAYDNLTGDFIWKITQGAKKVGTIAGCLDEGVGYIKIRVDGKLYFAHRLAWLYVTGEWPYDQIDHRDTVRTNNVWTNLRKATQSQNNYNHNLRSNNRSGFKGVSWSRKSGKWYAYIRIDGRTVNLGLHGNIEGAAKAYRDAALSHFGEFARFS